MRVRPYVEIWNLVFMQYDRYERSPHLFGLRLLPKPSIDTGAGLERLAAVMVNADDPQKFSNYDTGLFIPLIERAKELTGVSEVYPYRTTSQGEASLRIVADHSRAATFLVADGVSPSRDSRGYVLRKILRRGFWHARLLGATRPIFGEMAVKVCAVMQSAYPELDEQIQHQRSHPARRGAVRTNLEGGAAGPERVSGSSPERTAPAKSARRAHSQPPERSNQISRRPKLLSSMTPSAHP